MARSALICAAFACACSIDAVVPAPHTTLLQTPEAETHSGTATFTFSSNQREAAYVCELDGEEEGCSSPWTYTGLVAGEHTFAVTASGIGGTDPEPPSYTWTILPTDPVPPPLAQITGGPDAHWGSATATLWFVSDVAATFACTLDGAAAEACTSPRVYEALSDGDHTFTVAATADGVTQPVPASYTFRVDTAGPVTSVDDAPPDPVNETTARLAFHADEDADFMCQLDTGVPLPCASPATWSDLDVGPHQVRIWGTDAVGNAEVPGITTEWSIDLDAPETTLGDGPADPSNDTAPSFTFESDEDGTFLCALDDGTAAPCTSPHDLVDLSDGPHTFSVAAVDPAGNVDPVPPSHTWTVDVTPTAAPATATATAGNRSVAVSWAAVSGAVSYRLYVHDGTTESVISGLGGTSYTVTGLANCATYTVSVATLDAAGNESPRKTAAPASPKPTAPATFTVSPQANGNANLSWSGVSYATGYKVWYGTTSGGPYVGTHATNGASPLAISGTSTALGGLTPTTATYVAVSALDGSCESPKSVERTYDCKNTLVLCTSDATVDGVTASYRELWTAPQLPRVSAYPSNNFILMQDISVGGSLSQATSTLSTHFYGNGKTLSNYSTSAALFGTIGASGKVTDLAISGATITSGGDSGLVATTNNGTILRSAFSGTSSGSGSNASKGMAVAWNSGLIRDTTASGTLSASGGVARAGGLVGINTSSGLVDGCTSSVGLNGTGVYAIGGLVGTNIGWITRSTAHGGITKSGNDSPYVGGLVGYNNGFIDRCAATGDVVVDSNDYSIALVGGLVGTHQQGIVSRSYATGDITVGAMAQNRVGGLVGQIESGSTTDGHGNSIRLGVVVNSYALGDVLGNAQFAGGLVGILQGGSVVRRSWSGGDVTAYRAGGFFGAFNVGSGGVVADSFCLGVVSGSSASDEFGEYINIPPVLNDWFLGAANATSPTGALVVTDPALFVDASTYGPGATGTPSLPSWDVDYVWYVDGESLPALQETDIALAASASSAAASGGSITATLTVTDEQGSPAAGVAVRIWSTSTTVTFTPETGVTNASGVFTSVVTASSAQSVSVEALVFGDVWAVPVPVTFN